MNENEHDASSYTRNNKADIIGIKTLADIERAHITSALRETNWVIGGPRGAAAQLGLPRTTLMAMMKRLGIPNEASRNRSGQATRKVVRIMESGLASHLGNDSAADLSILEAAG